MLNFEVDHSNDENSPNSRLKIQSKLREYQKVNTNRVTSPTANPKSAQEDVLDLLDMNMNYENSLAASSSSVFLKVYGIYVGFGVIFILLIIILVQLGSTGSSTEIATANSHILHLEKQIQSLNDEIRSMNQQLYYQNIQLQTFNLTKTSSGETVVDVKATGIQFSEKRIFEVKETVVDQKRVWSSTLLKVFTDDEVHWKWDTNENIISSDESGLLLPSGSRVLNSGALKSDGEYSHIFTKAGIYYYTSENSQTLTGRVYVVDPPVAIESHLPYRGPIDSFIPSGVQRNLEESKLLTMDGCFTQCYSSSVGDIEDGNNIFANCKGDWLFLGISTKRNPSTFLKGGFAKSGIFQRALYRTATSSSEFYPVPLYENGIYWISAKYSGGYTYGFAPYYESSYSAGINPTYGICSSTSYRCCSNDGLTVGAGAICFDSVQIYDNRASEYMKVLYSSSCPVIKPPS